MTIIAERNHDSNGTVADNWTVLTTSTGISVTVAAALGGTAYGLEIDESSLPGIQRFRHNFTALSGDDLRMRVRVNFDNATQPGGVGNNKIIQYQVEDATRANAEIAIREVNATANTWDVIFFAREDGRINPDTDIGVGTIISGDTCCELAVIRATSAVSNDGIARAYVNGSLVAEVLTLDNFDIWASNPPERMELTTIQDANWGGTAYVDEFVLSDDSAEELCAGDGLTAAPMKKPCTIDSDGSNIYISALNDSGTPVLLKFSTALNAHASTVFDPGSGSDIGCQASRGDGSEITVAGNFGTNNSVQRTEDAGTTFSQIDDGATGGVTTFAVGPDSDDRILIADGDNATIKETLDAGTSWDTINNGGVAQTLKSLARLGIDVGQCIFGASSTDEATVLHSPNSGAELENIDNGAIANADCTGVIVN